MPNQQNQTTNDTHRYNANTANRIELKWQKRWTDRDTYHTPNLNEPGGEQFADRPKRFILDMFPYPSGVGLHVGHPLGYIATDIYARYLRAKGEHVLHAMGFDAFGLPAEQFAVEHGVHPRKTTETNIATMKAQLQRLGLAHDPKRSFATTDVEYYKWTQWIFLQIYNSWYDTNSNIARPVKDLVNQFANGERSATKEEANLDHKPWEDLDDRTKQRIIDSHRLAFLAEVPVNWCPGLGTVLANEEVTVEGRSERGNYPVYKKPLRQWMMRITSYAERLLKDLEPLDWPEPIKLMQRNWIGRSEGAMVDFPVDNAINNDFFSRRKSQKFPPVNSLDNTIIRVYTTRPDTLFGATYMVLAPEHSLVDTLIPDQWPDKTSPTWKGWFDPMPDVETASPREMVEAYRRYAAGRSDVERQIETKQKTGVFIGAYAINPATQKPIPIFIADYVMMGYGTGAIMAVPAHDERDYEFATQFKLPIVDVVHTHLHHTIQEACIRINKSKFKANLVASVSALVDFVALSVSQDRDDYDKIWGQITTRRSEKYDIEFAENTEARDVEQFFKTKLSDAGGSGSMQAQQRGTVSSIWKETLGAIIGSDFTGFVNDAAKGTLIRWIGNAFTESGYAVNSDNGEISLNRLKTNDARNLITTWLANNGLGEAAVNYKLRDWLFSRQRYWGEPFPIIYDDQGDPHPVPESHLPVELPPLDDFTPTCSDDPDALPEPPLARATNWTNIEIDGIKYRRETNTMPQWAGSCWYYLRYLDPTNLDTMVGSNAEKHWMLSHKDGTKTTSTDATYDPKLHHIGGVDLYVGGVEHAVLHLLYARFWHKVLFDLKHVSTPEPFGKLFSQGYIQAYAFTDQRGMYVPAENVIENNGEYYYKDELVTRSYGKMGKSLKNAVSPDQMFVDFGCDTLRLYEMSMGPLDQSKPWSTRDVIGSQRFLQRVWRNYVDEYTGNSKVTDEPASDKLRKLLHKTIDKVDQDMQTLAFNTAIAAMIELNNELVSLDTLPREIAEPFVKLLAPFVPHLAEELWEILGNKDQCVTFEDFPIADSSLLVEDEITLIVQVMGKVRAKVEIPADSDEENAHAAALTAENVQKHLEGKTIRKVIYVPGRLINFVAN